MKKFSLCAVAAALFICSGASAQDAQLLKPVQTIPMPNLKGRIDHMDVDVKGKRLFVSGLENGSVEVVDLQTGRWTKSIPGFLKPQGIAYVPALNKLFVASGDDGMVRVFRGDTLELLDAIKLELGPNRVAYDPVKQVLYVGYGGKDAGKDFGEVAAIDARTDKKIFDVQVAAHPSELLLDKSGQTLFVFISVASKIQVVDVAKRELRATWPVSSQRPGDAALDESSGRLLIGTHTPPEMIAMDAKTGKEVAHLPTTDGMDGVYFDAPRKRIYISGGRGEEIGSVYVYQQKNADSYELVGKIPTRPGAGTSFWSPELNRYYVAAPPNGAEPAALLVFEPVQ
ncbi:MAG TPA: YncE family protein [Candidatus Baltobacteraceae bacterium]|nr:YncE family protein [Candidatus Baltobacteraceae bacterium]